jgi:hypothetical protein
MEVPTRAFLSVFYNIIFVDVYRSKKFNASGHTERSGRHGPPSRRFTHHPILSTPATKQTSLIEGSAPGHRGREEIADSSALIFFGKRLAEDRESKELKNARVCSEVVSQRRGASSGPARAAPVKAEPGRVSVKAEPAEWDPAAASGRGGGRATLSKAFGLVAQTLSATVSSLTAASAAARQRHAHDFEPPDAWRRDPGAARRHAASRFVLDATSGQLVEDPGVPAGRGERAVRIRPLPFARGGQRNAFCPPLRRLGGRRRGAAAPGGQGVAGHGGVRAPPQRSRAGAAGAGARRPPRRRLQLRLPRRLVGRRRRRGAARARGGGGEGLPGPEAAPAVSVLECRACTASATPRPPAASGASAGPALQRRGSGRRRARTRPHGRGEGGASQRSGPRIGGRAA